MRWEHTTIGNVLSLIQNGVNCKQNKNGNGLKITRIETIADAKINYQKTGFANLNNIQKQKAVLEKDDILFSHINSPIHVGKTAIYQGDEPLYHGINLLRIRTIKAVDAKYFNFFLKSLFISGYWKRTAKQSVNQASVNQNDIKSIPFSYPPLGEQQRIVAKLHTAFAKIDDIILKTEKVIQTVELGLANMIDAKTNRSDSWDEFKVIELGMVQTGSTPKTSQKENYGTDVPFIKPPHFNSDGSIMIKENGLSYIGAKKSRVAPKNSILMVCIGATIGKVGLNAQDVCFNQQINSLTPNEEYDAELIYWQMRAKRFQIDVNKNAGQATLPIINKSKWQNLSIFLPKSLNKQVELREGLRELSNRTDEFVSNKRKKLIQLSLLKATLLSQELQNKAAA